MDVTHCNIGLPMGKFWMLPVITSARDCILVNIVIFIFICTDACHIAYLHMYHTYSHLNQGVMTPSQSYEVQRCEVQIHT